jgi:hypothetical protein
MMPESIIEEISDDDSLDSDEARQEEERARQSIMSIRKEYRNTGLSGSKLNFIVNLPREALMPQSYNDN